MPLKCGILFLGIVLQIDFVLESINCLFIFLNPYFDMIYGIVFAILLVGLLVPSIFFIMWYCKDNRDTRKLLPIGLIIAAVASLLLFLWILIYILVIYKYPYIYIGTSETYGNGEFKTSKSAYLLNKVLSPLFGALCYLFGYCFTKDWVDKHANQDRTWG